MEIWIPIAILIISLTSSHGQDIDASGLIDQKLNLDPKLRKALLKVLSKIDDESKEQKIIQQKQEITDNDQSSETNPDVKKVYDVHSFSADQGNNNQNGPVEEEINFIISKKHTPVELEPDTIVASSSDAESRASNSNLLSNRNKNTNNFVTAKPDDLSTPAPTAQTETDDVNSETGKVEEVQFFSAPLVAAFTVHQDELGLPHSVIPLYKDDSKSTKQRDINKATSSNVNNVLHSSVIIGDEKPSLFQQQLFQLYKERQEQQESLLQQRQRQREQEEQRRLQEQQRLLQLQLKEQELRRQQQENQRRQQLFRQQGSLVSFQPSISTQAISQPQPSFLVQQQLPNREAVDFLASLRQQSLQDLPLQQNHIPLNFNQALPPLQQINPQTPSISNFVLSQSDPGLNSNRVFRQEQQTGNFGLNQQQNSGNFGLNQQQNAGNFRLNQQQNGNFGSNQNTFRQEQQGSNFGSFRQQPSVQTSFQDLRQLQPPLQNSIQDFRRPIDFRQQPSYTLADRQLKDLLYQSGVYQIDNGQQEDLNIVSKVLSLNHFGGQFNGILRRSDDSQTFYFKN
ncbi:putative uncharacterized protein DDB_G0271606 [Chrysoperla carnea]|uniref:putative uncharacterized protein DDB_G0271606 n=1 Tax=Chrysoperla carnea TaxID=189513 RepID=UPI001D07AC86|nr:putative uncharacterized protein DDB_G0271606 [Chrysoperla carnea]